MPIPTIPKPPTFEETMAQMRQADARRRTEEDLRDREYRRRSDALLERFSAQTKFVLMAGVLTPLLFMWTLGSEMDRFLLGAGPLLWSMTFFGPIVMCFTFAHEIVVNLLLDEAFQRDLEAFSPYKLPGTRTRLPERYQRIVRSCRAAALIVPTAAFWIFAAPLDAAFGKSPAALLLPLGTLVAAWFAVTRVLIRRVLRPRYDRLRQAIRAQEERARAAADASK